mgnify:CR=1 FL=1
MSRDTTTYHNLISAAAECFAEKGFNATSVRDIATRAGLSLGAMYTYFKGKDELISAIVLEEQKTALAAQNQPLSGTHLQRLCKLLESCIGDVGYPASHRLWVEIMAESARNSVLRDTFIASDKVMRQGIARMIKDGIEAGEFSADVDAEAMTILLFAILDGLIARKAINPIFSAETEIATFRRTIQKMLS